MISELEALIIEFEGRLNLPQSPVAVVNKDHFCTGFATVEDAEDQIDRCRRLRQEHQALIRGGHVCHVCPTTQLPKEMLDGLLKPMRMSCPFGAKNGWTDHAVTVIKPLDYLR